MSGFYRTVIGGPEIPSPFPTVVIVDTDGIPSGGGTGGGLSAAQTTAAVKLALETATTTDQLETLILADEDFETDILRDSGGVPFRMVRTDSQGGTPSVAYETLDSPPVAYAPAGTPSQWSSFTGSTDLELVTRNYVSAQAVPGAGVTAAGQLLEQQVTKDLTNGGTVVRTEWYNLSTAPDTVLTAGQVTALESPSLDANTNPIEISSTSASYQDWRVTTAHNGLTLNQEIREHITATGVTWTDLDGGTLAGAPVRTNLERIAASGTATSAEPKLWTDDTDTFFYRVLIYDAGPPAALTFADFRADTGADYIAGVNPHPFVDGDVSYQRVTYDTTTPAATGLVGIRPVVTDTVDKVTTTLALLDLSYQVVPTGLGATNIVAVPENAPIAYISTEQLPLTAAVASLTVPPTATYAEIQFEHSDENVFRVARSTIDGTPPTNTLGDLRFNEEQKVYSSRAELLAFQIRRLDSIADLSLRIKYYG